MSDTIDKEYYQVIGRGSLAERLMVAARDRMQADFMRMVAPTPETSVLDVGVSDVQVPGANWLECVYPYPARIHACGLGRGDQFKQAFPLIDYTVIQPNARLPFADDAFDVATANAVLEHVGSRENQERFVAELVRVARKVFITVPHRLFPIEHHTSVPLLHFSDPTFRLACRVLGKSYWTEPENLILMTRERLRGLAPPHSRVGHTGLPLGPFSSNLYLFHEKPRRPQA